MTNEKRSCHTCEHQRICYLERRITDAIMDATWMLKDTPRPWTDIFGTLAEACNQYIYKERAESK